MDKGIEDCQYGNTLFYGMQNLDNIEIWYERRFSFSSLSILTVSYIRRMMVMTDRKRIMVLIFR